MNSRWSSGGESRHRKRKCVSCWKETRTKIVVGVRCRKIITLLMQVSHIMYHSGGNLGERVLLSSPPTGNWIHSRNWYTFLLFLTKFNSVTPYEGSFCKPGRVYYTEKKHPHSISLTGSHKTNSGASQQWGFSLDAAARYLPATAVYLDTPPNPIHLYFIKDKLGSGETPRPVFVDFFFQPW